MAPPCTKVLSLAEADWVKLISMEIYEFHHPNTWHVTDRSVRVRGFLSVLRCRQQACTSLSKLMRRWVAPDALPTAKFYHARSPASGFGCVDLATV